MDITAIFALLGSSVYVLIFAGCFTEGSVVMMATGVLAHQGLVAFWPAFAALVLGDILSDIVWYCLGRFGGRRFVDRWGYLLGATPGIVSVVERRFRAYHTSILWISKLTMGFGFAIVTLMTAGLLRVPFHRYVAINLAGGLIWVFALFMVGFHFGNLLESIPPEARLWGFVAGALFMFLVLRIANRRLATLQW